MKTCNSKVSHTCGGGTNYAICTQYEGDVNTESSLVDDTCFNLEETTQDIYNQLENITDLSELGQGCLEYVETEEGKIVVKNVLLKFEQEICDLKEEIENLKTVSICNTSITDCDFDLGTLVDDCGEQPQTIGELLQILINQNNT